MDTDRNGDRDRDEDKDTDSLRVKNASRFRQILAEYQAPPNKF